MDVHLVPERGGPVMVVERGREFELLAWVGDDEVLINFDVDELVHLVPKRVVALDIESDEKTD